MIRVFAQRASAAVRFLAPMAACLALSATACSSSTSSSTSDAGGGGDAGGGPPALNGCTEPDYVDLSAASADRTVVWDFTIKPPCMIVKAGQTVTFNGDFSAHPITAFNGDSPNPFSTPQGTGSSRTFTFTAAGSFGFHCENHPGQMHGVVFVEP